MQRCRLVSSLRLGREVVTAILESDLARLELGLWHTREVGFRTIPARLHGQPTCTLVTPCQVQLRTTVYA